MTKNLFLPKLFCRHTIPCQLVQSILKPEFCTSRILLEDIYIYIYLSLCDFFGVEEQKKSTPEYTWQSVGVLDYSPEKKQYMVQKADQNGCVRDSKGKPVVGGAQSNKGTCQRVKLI